MRPSMITIISQSTPTRFRIISHPMAFAVVFLVFVSAILVIDAPSSARAEARSDSTTFTHPSHSGQSIGPMTANAESDPATGSAQVTFVPVPPPSTTPNPGQHLRDDKSWKSFKRWLNRKFHPVIHLGGMTVRAIVGSALGVVGTVTCSQLYLTPVVCTVVGGLLGAVFALIASSKCGQKGIFIPIPDYWNDWCG
ncbi:hypothetical protein B5P19_15980 [Clavibacter sepedonicus]|uniref:Membrane protein n=2 Tax=Microbacteriaceae TaxID=85023 RepID=B0RJ23_CLASE|nr:hypothetical protein B5P19_15980 [Clavibacter sepedonicus]OQJ50891.1 hypothetical protein B5P20_15770 [Clavibacter sepedonicus]CAQ03212.1 putative membrane protein [Clavibacter sepedonicus]